MLALSAVLAVAVFIIDLRFPLGAAFGVIHVAAVLLTLWSPRLRDTAMVAAGCSALIFLGYFLSPEGEGAHGMVAVNRVLAVLAVWVTAGVCHSRKRLEGRLRRGGDRLRESEAHLRLMVENLPAGAVYVEGDRLSLNRSAEEITGYSRAEIRTVDDWFSRLHPGREGEARRQYVEAREAGLPERRVIPFTHRSGQQRLIESATFASGDFEIWLLDDVTGRERTEREVQDREARMRSILDNASDGIVTIDEDGTVETFNRAAERMFGYSANEMIGRSVAVLMASPHREGHFDYIRRYLETGEMKVIGIGREVSGLRKDGTAFPLELGVSETLSGARRVFTGILRDLSERHRLESEFHQAQKLEAVGRLAGGIAHDFNNLLMGIIGCCKIAASHLGMEDEAKRQMMEIDAAARRGTTLTRQLLTFSRRRTIDPKPIRFLDVVKSSETLLRRLLGEDVILTVEAMPSGGQVVADPGQLEQILMNLAVNARDAMPDGGELVIRISAADGGAETGERRVRLEVKDTGYGMDEETLARAFEPFFTTKKEGEGTGLGLATVYGIVKQLGGEIALLSEPCRGTTIRIDLQRADDSLFRVEAPEEERTERVGHETVLVVEDDRLVRAGVRHFLNAQGYEVLTAGNPTEATQICGEHEGPIDLVLTDVIMHGVGGADLARHIQARRPESRVMFMSALPRDVLVQQGRLAPNQPYIEKPFSDTELTTRIREVLDAASS